ncbi:MAG: SNF2-related protein [Brevinemataceae bacterium]
MKNSLFCLNITIDFQGQKISQLSINLELSPQLQHLFSEKIFMNTLISAFPELSDIERNFLIYWQTIYKNQHHIVLKAPFPLELIYFFGEVPSAVIYPNQTKFPLQKSSKFYIPKVHLNTSQAVLSLKDRDHSFLIDSIIPFIINENKIHPLDTLFDKETINYLYLNKQTQISTEENIFIMKELKKEHSPIAKKIETPEIVSSSKIYPVAEFEYLKNENKYQLSFKLEAEINNKKEHFIFDLENLRKMMDKKNPFLFSNEKNNKSLLIELESEEGKNIQKIISSSFKNFYSILGEIHTNKIITKDKSNFFERFLPDVFQEVILYKDKKQTLLIFEQKTSTLSVEKLNKTGSKEEWLAVHFKYSAKEIRLSLKDLEKIINQGFVEIDDHLVVIPEEEIEPIAKLLELNKKNSSNKEITIPSYFLPWLLISYPQIEIPQEFSVLKEFIQDNQLPEIGIPFHIENTLRSYQIIGLQRMALLHHFGFGAILADEMGLGKTLQILALFDLYLKNGNTALVVTPSTLALNWFAEIQKFYPTRFKVKIINSHKEERIQQIQESFEDYDILITSYHMLSSDIEEYKKFQFSFAVLDEAQHIKNKKSKRSQSVKQINAQTKIAVSGTPLENHLSELWSVFDFIMPGFLGSYSEFQHNHEELLNHFDTDKRAAALKRLSQMCSPFIIRRTKATVYKELPPKIEQTIFTELTEKQKTLYLEILSRVKNHFVNLIENNSLNTKTIEFLTALTKLRQIALHPGLVYPELIEKDPFIYSAKMRILLELLEDALASGHRVLIFSQFVSMLGLIKNELIKHNKEFLYIDGTVKNRVDLTEEYNTGNIPIFLISLKAGGVGLNLIGADTVILFDPWWNPAVENQAIDRAHRIGQNKVVNVYRIMTKGTIEEKIYTLQQRKNHLFDNIIQENANFGTFSSEDLLSLLAVDDENQTDQTS